MRAVEKLLATKRLLAHIARDFTPVAMFQSFSPEDMVLADLIYSDLVHEEYTRIEMFTIDTGRLPDRVLHSMELMNERYGNVLKVYYPHALELESFDASYRLELSNRMADNEVRLFKPLKRALSNKKAWITASHIGGNIVNTGNRVSWDGWHQMPRFNPLARWTPEEIRHYAKRHDLPVPGRLAEIHRPRDLHWQQKQGQQPQIRDLGEKRVQR